MMMMTVMVMVVAEAADEASDEALAEDAAEDTEQEVDDLQDEVMDIPHMGMTTVNVETGGRRLSSILLLWSNDLRRAFETYQYPTGSRESRKPLTTSNWIMMKG